MSSIGYMRYNPGAVRPLRRWTIRAVGVAAAVLATRSPVRIQAVLRKLRWGARPDTVEHVTAVRWEVEACSLATSGGKNCLRRALTVALVCRLGGTWPTWAVGVRTLPPFAAHSWVEAEGEPVGEDVPADYFRKLISVPPVPDGHHAGRT
jgi:hypothetical protein